MTNMNSFSPGHLKKLSIPVSTSWLMGTCMEAKGKQDLWARQKPEVLTALREQAMIQSAESSNRIEGVTVPKARLAPLVLGKTVPRDRSEEEVLGYRRALDWIHKKHAKIPLEPDTFLQLHEMAQRGSGDAGRWKARDNEIIEFSPHGERSVRFRPVSARETAKAMQLLCLRYGEVCEHSDLPPLLAVAAFVLDFLCIHPFRDGNGRVSRLATTLLLHQHGYSVGRYVSLERLIEESKEEYYRTLRDSSRDWHSGKHDLIPWCNYFLSILKEAYREFGRRVETAKPGPGKSALARMAILRQAVPFNLAEIQAACPGVSSQLIKKVLSKLKSEGVLRLSGHGRSAEWHVVPRTKGAN
ncbi:MAG: Fic family protein [Deltaproteobacteria bacterium]|nr:Fic family protein [Deltaproteobacteria bacterium]